VWFRSTVGGMQAQPVIERKPPAHTPVILHVPFRCPEQVTSDRPVVGLRISVEIAEKGVGKAIACIIRIVAIIGETVSAAITDRGRLHFVIALQVEPGLDLMRFPYLAQIVGDHVRGIRQPFGKLARKAGVDRIGRNITETDARQPIGLADRIPIKLRRIPHPRAVQQRRVLRLDIDSIKRFPNRQLVHERGRKDLGHVKRVRARGAIPTDRRKVIIYTAVDPGSPWRQQVAVIVDHAVIDL
jgi:hypothetical protein